MQSASARPAAGRRPDVHTQYEHFRRVMLDFVEPRSTDRHDGDHDGYDENDRVYVLGAQCGKTELAVGRDKRAAALIDLAYSVTRWRNDLPSIGYPSAIWRELVDDFEDDQVVMIARDIRRARHRAGVFYRLLAQHLQEYQYAFPDAQDVSAQGFDDDDRDARPGESRGCREVRGFPVTFSVSPPGAEVWTISKFDQRLCASYDFDRTDITCDGWTRVPDNIHAVLRGAIEYVAIWPGHLRVWGRAEITESSGKIIAVGQSDE
jgi:hypothetical protein